MTLEGRNQRRREDEAERLRLGTEEVKALLGLPTKERDRFPSEQNLSTRSHSASDHSSLQFSTEEAYSSGEMGAERSFRNCWTTCWKRDPYS